MKVIVDNYLFEALKPSEFRGLMRVGRDLAMKRIEGIWDKLKSQADSTNRNGDRLFFEISASPLEDKLHRYLKANNYEIVDYKGGLVKKVGDKNNVKIVKVLTMLGKDDPTASKLQRNYELLKSVNKLNDYDSAKSESAVAEDYIMVISKSPYDLGGMSTDRKEWDSCMNLRDGINRHYVPIDIERGTLVSYLVNPTDKNIEKPTGRILIKPYVEIDNKDEVLYGIQHNRVKYGKDNPEYVKTLINLLDKAQEEKTGIFRLDDELYYDSGSQFTIPKPDAIKPEKILDYLGIKNYKINPDGTVDVDGNVDLYEEGLVEIPIKFGVVKGDFDISQNNLLSLKNCPRVVTGKFSCSFNRQLSSLKNGPKSARDFDCSHCNLTSLEHAPKEVHSNFNCSFNQQLSSLKNVPKNAKYYNFSFCNLTSLEHAPDSIEFDFVCNNNDNLTSLVGGPKYVGRDYVCRKCDLKSLEGAPNELSGSFDCSENENLTSLIDGPKKVEKLYNCSRCNLTSLEGVPKEVTIFVCFRQVNGHEFTEEYIKKVVNVKGRLYI
jgi:hypothetical protein